MKKIITICLLLATTFTVNAQYKPVTISQLKELIGYKKSEASNILKKKGYFFTDEEAENKDDGYHHLYYSDENMDNEIEMIYDGNLPFGAGFEGITDVEYNQLIAYVKVNSFYLKEEGVWETYDKKWSLSIHYRKWPEFKVLGVTLYNME